MNLYELDRLIQSFIDEDLPENKTVIEFYQKKRVQLIKMINADIKQKMKRL